MIKILVALSLLLIANSAHAERNDDGYCKTSGTSHGDNTPSEKKFKEYLNKDICQLADCIDDMRCKGEIRNIDSFKDTKSWNTSNILMKGCMIDRYDLPDKGHSALQAYEIQRCATGDYST